MSREKGQGTKSSEQQATAAAGESTTTSIAAGAATAQSAPSSTSNLPQFATAPGPSGLESELGHTDDARKIPAATESASQSTEEAVGRPRQVIAVSASKGPAAFFNLARKFLVTDEMCDLSALEGAIVSAVDAAHLLERSKLATIVRIQTSYVTVEPKRRKPTPSTATTDSTTPSEVMQGHTVSPGSPGESHTRRTSSGRELRRARIVITVKRTDSYKKWLDDNPLQAIIAGDAEDAVDADEEG